MTAHSSTESRRTIGGTCWPSSVWVSVRCGAQSAGTLRWYPPHVCQHKLLLILNFQIKTLEILFHFFLQFFSLFALPHLPCPTFKIQHRNGYFHCLLNTSTKTRICVLSVSLASVHLTDSGQVQQMAVSRSRGPCAASCRLLQSRTK